MRGLESIINSFRDRTIAVVGDIGVDENLTGVPCKFSFDAPIPVYTKNSHKMILGCAANTMANIHSLSGNVIPISFVGDSPACKYVRNFFTDKGVSTEGLLEDVNRPVHNYLRLYIQKPHAPKQQVIRFDNTVLPPITPDQEDRILNVVSAVIAKVDAIVVADYSKGTITDRVITEVSKIADAAGKVCTGDSRYQVNSFQNYTVITPNDQEAIAAVRNCDPSDITEDDISDISQLRQIGTTLSERLCLDNLVITRGKYGMTVFKGDESRDLPVVAKDVFDPTGAGDTAAAAIALSLSSGADVFQAAEIANYASGIVVGKYGTATVDCEELLGSISCLS